MDEQACWRVIEAQRLAIADLAEGLTTDEWESPSLCTRWRVRDVVAHVAMTPQPPGMLTLLRGAIRARGNFDELNRRMASQHAQRPTEELVDELRRYAASRKRVAVTSYANLTFDTLVHGQDIAIPLGRTMSMPLEAAAFGATRVWRMGWPFWAKRRLRGIRLSATDTQWTVGEGVDVCGPIDTILMLLTGRTASLPRLSGDGVAELSSRLRTAV